MGGDTEDKFLAAFEKDEAEDEPEAPEEQMIPIREDYYAISFCQYHKKWNTNSVSPDVGVRRESEKELANNFRICIMIFALQGFIAAFVWIEMGGVGVITQPEFHVVLGRFFMTMLLHFQLMAEVQ